VLAGGRDSAPFVALDSDHYKLLKDFEERFPAGPPSLVECDRFEVTGDVHFGAGVVARGSVVVQGPREIEDGTEL
jgi:UTP--glucose-1-phosphate uridylyltransferase